MHSYKKSFYSETLQESIEPDEFVSGESFDVCIIGGGISSVSCAHRLLEDGLKVGIIEGNKIFSGASGLNGGFVLPGYSLSIGEIEKKVGIETAKDLFSLTVSGVKKIDENIKKYNIQSANQIYGKVDLFRYAPSKEELAQPEYLLKKYNYEVTIADDRWLYENLSSRAYKKGFIHKEGFHIHPLNYGLALTKTLQAQGLKAFEGEKVNDITQDGTRYLLKSTSGHTYASQIVICTGGYTSDESPKIKKSLLPVTTYVAVTEPNESIPIKHIKTKCALGDNRRASDYYRVVNGNQLLWGGRITAFPTRNDGKIKKYIKQDILTSYPGMKDIKIKTSWSGIMGYALHKMPYLGRMNNGIWYCTAFGGRGLASGTAGGRALAEAILGNDEKVKLFEPFSMTPAFGLLGKLAVEATYKKYIFTDKIKEAKEN